MRKLIVAINVVITEYNPSSVRTVFTKCPQRMTLVPKKLSSIRTRWVNTCIMPASGISWIISLGFWHLFSLLSGIMANLSCYSRLAPWNQISGFLWGSQLVRTLRSKANQSLKRADRKGSLNQRLPERGLTFELYRQKYLKGLDWDKNGQRQMKRILSICHKKGGGPQKLTRCCWGCIVK